MAWLPFQKDGTLSIYLTTFVLKSYVPTIEKDTLIFLLQSSKLFLACNFFHELVSRNESNSGKGQFALRLNHNFQNNSI